MIVGKFLPILTLFLGLFLGACSSKKTKTQAEPEPAPPPQEEQVVEEAPVEPSGPSEEELRRRQMQAELDKVMKPIYFEYDQITLTTESKETLSKIGNVLKKYPDIRNVKIEGHADERGTNEYNFALGDKRAAAIKSYLRNYGVDDARLLTVSFGEEKPAVEGSGEDAWSKNRRGEFEPQ